MESSDQALQRAIATISQSDPLTKLLEQVKLGRMKPTDAGLRAVTDSWLGTYQKMIESAGLSRQSLRRIDPNPRVAILIEYGVLTGEQRAVATLRASFERAVAAAME
jgi:rhamnose utilization protein RhaD (predicted bifunctional aldolase and dehydrogenase)